MVNYTSKYKPWKLVYFEVFATKTEAILRERFFKSGKGREWLKNKLANINSALVSDYGSSAQGEKIKSWQDDKAKMFSLYFLYIADQYE